jgi:HSP20 family protein
MCFASAYLSIPSRTRQTGGAWSRMRCLVAHEWNLPPKRRQNESITYWDPFRELEDMQHRLSTVLGRQLNRRQDGDKESITVAEWAPVVDIIEDETEYLIKVDLPEIKKEEVKVTVENGVLVLSGERKLEKEEKGRKYHRIERAYGSFGRTFSLPDNADAEKVNAEFNDGVLKLHIAKKEAARPKQIEVKIS